MLHRTIGPGIVKEVHIKRESSGKSATRTANNTTNKIDKSIGLDMGIKNFIYDSDGHVVAHPSILNKSARKLGKAQRIFSRRIKGSNNRNKQRFKVVRLHEKIANQRKDFLHKLSSRYVSKYNIIFVEDLRIDNMIRHNTLSKTISDSSWSTYFNKMEYKQRTLVFYSVK